MKVKLNMDNGMSISIDNVADIDEVLGQFRNAAGVMVNAFMRVNPSLYINPSHISTIQVEE